MKYFVINPSINQKFHLDRRVKPISFLHHFRSIVASALLCISFTNAADVTWDITPGTVGVGNGSLTGGSGIWNTSNGNWTTNGGVNNRAWVNANNDTAIFGGTVGTGTVTLGTGINVGKLIFNTQNYSITGGILTVGTAGSITANANASIRSVLAGGAITKAGAGTLTLFGNNSYTGTMTVSAGTLSIGDGITNGTLSSSYRINSPGALRVRYNTNGVPAAWTGTIWNNFTGTGTLALATGKSSDGWGDAALTSNFTGTLQIQSGRVGTSAVTGGGFGGAKAIRVFAGGQLMDWRGSAITQNLTIAGTGYGEGAMECAIRMGENATPTILSGLVSLSGNVTIGARGTGILTNVISGAAGSTLTVGTPYSNGTVVIAADNTYVGPTMIAAGTLQVGGGGATGTLGASTVVNNGRLVFYRTGTLNVAQSIMGSGAISQEGSGTVTLAGANSYLGATTVNAGTLAIGDGITNGTLSSSSYQINSPGTLRIRYNTSGVPASWTETIWNKFTGNGTLALVTGKSSDGWGNAALTSNFTGTLQIEGGRVSTSSVTGGGFGGAWAIKVLAGGQLTDWRGSAITQDLTIAGTGYGEGGLECAIRMGEDATPTILSGLVYLSGNVTIGARGTGILTNVISGIAGSTLTVGTWYCNGKVILAGNNTYAGATTISAGTLQIGNGQAAGTLGAGTVTNNGTLLFSRSGALNVAQSITGSGAVTQEGSGTVTLAGANTYVGATTINAGALTLGRSGALPTGSAVIIGDATLDAGDYTNSAGMLGVALGGTAPARIVFGSGATLAFSDSSALLWPDFLQLVGNFVSGVSLRVGTTSSGLTDSQLQRIVAPGFSGFALNAQGYVTATAYTAPNFDSWQMANNTSQSFSDDLDGDGVTNGIEYFLHGTGDSSGADVFASVISSVGNPSVTWTKASTYPGTYGTNFVVQTSSTSASGPWTSQTAGSNLILNGNSVKYIFPAGAQTYVRLVVNETVQEASLAIDTSNAIPLRSHRYRQDMFAVSLLGSAIKPSNGDPVYEIFFDTGSTQTCLPYGVLNRANLTVEETNIRVLWNNLADKVRGQLIVKSKDGLTTYTLDNFTFYAMKNEDGTDMPEDRTLPYGRGIIGAFPFMGATSFVGELTAKYSTNGLGSGIISESPAGNLVANWRYHRSYLKFGNDPAVAARLNWTNWKPWHTGQNEFDPITVPGFKISYRFPAVSGQTYPDLVMPNRIATIDTGAGDLVMQLGPNNPHLQAPYSQFFNTARVPYWYDPAVCRALNYGVDINVAFTGSTGKTSSYTFPTADWNGGYIPNVATIGNWDSSVPWTLNTVDMPTNRINLGNSIYFFCTAYHWDFTNQRIGFFFN
jgi:autotransporter-associated beta strand protein